MGASDSKLAFRKGIFRLSEEKEIPADDAYWTSFWELPESTEDVFSLFSPADIRRTRDTSLANLETLVLAVTSRLFILRHHPSFPDPEIAPEKDALNCIRVLTRLLPYLYEADHLQAWEQKFFWGIRRKRTRQASIRSEVLYDENEEKGEPKLKAKEQDFEEAKPLAEELIDTLIDLLFFSEFTLPKVAPGKPKVAYSIWEKGVGCNTPPGTSKEFENNRCEILRLLLTLTSKSMYLPPNILPTKGTKALTYICTCPDKQVVLSVLCSLLNTTLKYNPGAWRVPYDHMVFKDSKHILVTYCLHFLLVLLIYPIPEAANGEIPRNYFRHFLGRLHRPQDFQFLIDGMKNILNQPIQASSSYLPGSQKTVKWAPEIIMLFWEALQSNKRFRAYIVDTDRAHEFMILILFYALDQKNDLSKQGVVRMCVFVLQTMSTESNFGKRLNKKFEGNETLPQSMKILNFRGSYADYLIISVYTLITSNSKLDAIYPALLAIVNNVAAYVENLSGTASSRMMQLFASMSSPGFLLANETNHDLLQSLLEAMNSIVEHQYSKNVNLVYAVLCSKKRFEALRSFTLETGQEEIERQNRRRKERIMSDSESISSPTRTNSIDSFRSHSTALARTPTLSNVPEDGSAFAIGDDEDSDDETDLRPTPSHSSPSRPTSRAASISSSVDDAVPMQLRGLSEKARGKMPANSPALSFSRHNSTTSLNGFSSAVSSSGLGFIPSVQWIESWLPELPLHTILTLISELGPDMPPPHSSAADTRSFMQAMRRIEIRGIEPSPIRVHLFEWSPLSIGWYESLLWGFIFVSEMVVSKGTVGVWNGTGIKLFKVQETVAQGPTLLAPRGAVDAVGSNLVQRIGSLNLRGTPNAAADGQGQRAASNGNGRPMTVREV